VNTNAHRDRIEASVIKLMMTDGFGPDEVLSNLSGYSRDVFGSNTPTGRLRVHQCVMRILRAARRQFAAAATKTGPTGTPHTVV
jgi:uncharacterized circularly permuted ATP-grasp superfamily protein